MNALSLVDKKIIDPYLQFRPYYASDGTFANLFIWQNLYRTKFAIDEDFLFINGGCEEHIEFCGFMYPFGEGDLSKPLYKIREYCLYYGIRPRILGITEDMKNELQEKFPGNFIFIEDRNSADYIYLTSDLSSLVGKKYHAKKNLVNKFLEEYDERYSFSDITPDNLGEVFEYQKKWMSRHENLDAFDIEQEAQAIKIMLENFEALNGRGLILKVDGEICAYTMGSEANKDVFVVQFEKADVFVKGAYQFINKAFADRLKAYKYLNREDDMGIEGLRKAKLSYHPAMLLKKYDVVWAMDEK